MNRAKETLYKYQEDLERQQREEEDQLLTDIRKENLEAVERMEEEFNKEWEKGLQEIARQYEKKERNIGVSR